MNFCRSFLFVLVGLFQLIGCQWKTTEPETTDLNYFPLETGRYVVYDVQERQYTLNAAPLLQTYQLKEVVGQPYTDVTGQTAYRLMRFRRVSDSQPWQTDSVWSARIVNNEAIRTENGRDFVQLVFPISNQLSWDGNRRNALGLDTYTARNAGQFYRVQDKQFDQIVTVLGKNDSTLIAQTKHVAVYAQQVGLIYKEQINVQFCSSSPACIGHNQIDYGTQQVYRIQAYGNQ
ncbi:hypothetical protein GO755_29900 [Spirosoma sp. HMF4905]|uniref:Uncharacterized protein n=1 Tax=Spirosoma arboris TaxID=2682092 RepID=A0A7K1SKF4_9BACT|nr:hypothetical protein [Spirosoma arboris]MVM34282.1 hypothetical protein [Spirosoma arboris]